VTTLWCVIFTRRAGAVTDRPCQQPLMHRVGLPLGMKGDPVRYRVLRLSVSALVVSAMVASCGGSAEETTTVPEDTTTTTVDDASMGLEGVRPAVVQIVSQGSFVDPQEGQLSNVGRSGTGFIIDSEGLAVTNNHVVTGAAFLQVYMDGQDKPLNAKVLGVSECSDLAVIDIDGDGYPTLDWFDGNVASGMSVYAAGFPLGDPEFTLTEGIISKERASGETSWASVDSVLEHTAQILPGNSGGPLVTDNGEVVGVNYAGLEELDLNYAIGQGEINKVLDSLIDGEDVTSIGVNGTAFLNEEYSGIWVSAVESGSPAAAIGIKGGDIITEIEGLVLATDGTMADYCDILRSHDADDQLTIEVFRSETQEYLEGTLNKDEELKVVFSFVQELADDVEDTSSAGYEYSEVYDDDGLLVMEIPTAWSDVDGSGWVFNDELVGNAIFAAPDLDGYYTSWEVPGVFFGASSVLASQINPGDLLDWVDFSEECAYDGQYAYEDVVYTGSYDVWTNCGGTGSMFVVLEAYPEGGEFVILVQMQIVSDADLEAFDKILGSFYVFAD